jgi:hypothetical protein
VQTHMSCCFITTLESISREEVTTEAHVSSAEDSRAKTVNKRERRKRVENLDCGRCRVMRYIPRQDRSDEKTNFKFGAARDI